MKLSPDNFKFKEFPMRAHGESMVDKHIEEEHGIALRKSMSKKM